MSVLARFADEGEEFAEGFDKAATELGNVYLPKAGVRYEAKVSLGYSSFIQPPRITVMGALPVKN